MVAAAVEAGAGEVPNPYVDAAGAGEDPKPNVDAAGADAAPVPKAGAEEDPKANEGAEGPVAMDGPVLTAAVEAAGPGPAAADEEAPVDGSPKPTDPAEGTAMVLVGPLVMVAAAAAEVEPNEKPPPTVPEAGSGPADPNENPDGAEAEGGAAAALREKPADEGAGPEAKGKLTAALREKPADGPAGASEDIPPPDASEVPCPGPDEAIGMEAPNERVEVDVAAVLPVPSAAGAGWLIDGNDDDAGRPEAAAEDMDGPDITASNLDPDPDPKPNPAARAAMLEAGEGTEARIGSEAAPRVGSAANDKL